MPERFQGKVVLITGAAGGIGAALCRAFGAEGATIALLDLPGPRLEAAREALRGRGIEAEAFACDVCDEATCGEAIEAVVARLGGVDILVNNAGISHHGLFEETSPSVIKRVMAVNFFGAVHCTHAALPSLLERRGVVAALSSVAGFAPLLGRTGYAASKHALHGFFDSLREELHGRGVGVLLVCPAFTDTAIDSRALGAPAAGSKAVVGRLLRPEDVARAVVEAVARRRPEIHVGTVARASGLIHRLSPALYARLMRRRMAQR